MLIEKFIPDSFKVLLQNLIDHVNFAWFFNKNSTYEGQDGIFQLVHVVKNEYGYTSEHFEKIKPLLYFFEMHTGFEITNIYRIKINMMTQRILTEEQNKLAVHTDVELTKDDFVTFIYYVNDSDGDTIIYNKDKTQIVERIEPKAGNCAWFKSNVFHNATPPKDHVNRIVINCVLQVKNN
jgi:hypothetical protein